MPSYRFRSEVRRQALRWLRTNESEMKAFIPRNLGPLDIDSRTGELLLDTGHGQARAAVGDYVILDQRGLPYPCSAVVFEATYEPVE